MSSEEKTEAKEGEIITRFPPEPNAYIHLGHAKSIYFNFLKHKDCKCILRLDDTNPEKEKKEYADGIIDTVTNFLKFVPWKITYTSDYFDQLYNFAVVLIKNGLAYTDFTPTEDIKRMRGGGKDNLPGIESEYRNKSIDYHLEIFEGMKKGKYDEGSVVLRLKIDMNHPEPTMRDPNAYRIKYSPHFRTGDKWCIYPTYEYSHGIVDALENITYSYCTMEFRSRREQYYWSVDRLRELGYEMKKVIVEEFGKLTIEKDKNILSKRNLIELVNSGKVDGFDDPRLLTIVGMQKRGYTAKTIMTLVEKLTMDCGETMILESYMKDCLRDELNTSSPRVFAVLNPVYIVLSEEDNKSTEINDNCEHPDYPGTENKKSHTTLLTNNLLIDSSDFRLIDNSDYYGLAPNKMVRLRYGPFIKCGDTKNIKHIECIVARDETKFNRKKIKGIIHWLSMEGSVECIFELYDSLLIGEGKFNTNSKCVKYGRVEKEVLKDLTLTYQFERLGYFKYKGIDDKGIPIFMRVVELVDKWKKSI